LGNEFLGQIKNVDAILHVVRAFESTQAVHTLGTIDPERDMEIVRMELILKDLEMVSKHIENEKDQEKKALLFRIKEVLNNNQPVKSSAFSEEERQLIKDLQFLTGKPEFFVLNISESEMSGEKIKILEEKDFLVVCAKLEADLAALTPSEQKEYLKASGIIHSGLDKVIKEAYELLSLITFYTIKGGKEVRAWPIKKETKAYDAAGLVHTDMMKGFIKAEVIPVDDLFKLERWHTAHEKGKVRLEGRDYIMQDGDVVEFKFQA
jgi:GTP-binding protein YchF